MLQIFYLMIVKMICVHFQKQLDYKFLLVLSFIWTTVFSLYVFSYTTFAFGWAGLFLAHIGLIFAVYMTFKQFHRAEESLQVFFKQKILILLKSWS